MPHFQVVLGGQWKQNAGSYGLPVVAVPSKNIPKVVSRLTERYLADRQTGEVFKDFVKRTGKAELKNMLDGTCRPAAGDRTFLAIGGDVREYTLGDMGEGECAGEVVSLIEFGLAAAERELFEAQLAFEKGKASKAGTSAYRSMLTAARALVQLENPDVSDDPDQIVAEFRLRFYDTSFFDPFAEGNPPAICSPHTKNPGSLTPKSPAAT